MVNYLRLMDQLPDMTIELLTQKSIGPKLRQKVSSAVETPESDVIAIGWTHFRNVMIMLVGADTGSLLPLPIEIVWFKIGIMIKNDR